MRLADVLRSTGFFEHEITLTTLAERRPLFMERCKGRSVLHVGCCDVPVFDPDTNLHLALAHYTDRLDGLDVSEEGIAVLRSHVAGEYFTDPAQITRQYDLVLAPEVIEHTDNPQEFLSGLFSVRATQYLISAPHYQWYEQSRREGNIFHERVHPDHKAWYSPFTLLRTLRPFIHETDDEVEVFLFASTGSVAVAVTKAFTPEPFHGRRGHAAGSVEEALAEARALSARGDRAAALSALEAAQLRFSDARVLHAELELLLGAGQNLEALRRGVAWLRTHANDAPCLSLCADAAAALGDHARAERWRTAARALSGP